MRILLCLNHDIMSNIALNLLRETLLAHEVKIVLSQRVGNGKNRVEDLALLEQRLPCTVIFPLLESIGKPSNGSYYTFGQVEMYDNISISTPANVNHPDTIEMIRNFAPDVILSIRYGQIFKDEIIAIPKHGIINLHSGLLPDYRGILATFQAMLHGEKQIGCTLHYITDPTIDTGPVIAKSHLLVDKNKSLFWHVSELYKGGTDIVKNTLADLANGKEIKTTPQNGPGNYFSTPTEDEIKNFRELGYRLFDGDSYMDVIRNYTNVT